MLLSWASISTTSTSPRPWMVKNGQGHNRTESWSIIFVFFGKIYGVQFYKNDLQITFKWYWRSHSTMNQRAPEKKSCQTCCVCCFKRRLHPRPCDWKSKMVKDTTARNRVQLFYLMCKEMLCHILQKRPSNDNGPKCTRKKIITNLLYLKF